MLGGGVEDPGQPALGEQGEQVAEALRFLEHERHPQQGGVGHLCDGTDEGVVVQVAHESPHRHVLAAPHKLAGDLGDPDRRHLGDHGAGAPRIEFDRDVGEKRGRELAGDVDRPAGLEHAGHQGRQHRPEGPLADRGADRRRKQSAGRREAVQGRAVGVPQHLGHAVTQEPQVLRRQPLEVGELTGIALQHPRQLEDLGPRLQAVDPGTHRMTRRIGPRSRRGIMPMARSPAAAIVALWR